MSVRRVIVFTAIGVAAAACSPGPAPSLYFLDTPAPGVAYDAEAPRIGLAEVALPAYARKVQIASRLADQRIVQDDDHRWAAPPDEAISKALARALEATLGGPALLRPYPRGFQPDVQARVTFDRFLRGGDGAAEMAGQYLILDGDGGSVLRVARFDISEPASGDGYEGYMRAVAAGLSALGARIADDIQ